MLEMAASGLTLFSPTVDLGCKAEEANGKGMQRAMVCSVKTLAPTLVQEARSTSIVEVLKVVPLPIYS